jgi:hypothetical protein
VCVCLWLWLCVCGCGCVCVSVVWLVLLMRVAADRCRLMVVAGAGAGWLAGACRRPVVVAPLWGSRHSLQFGLQSGLPPYCARDNATASIAAAIKAYPGVLAEMYVCPRSVWQYLDYYDVIISCSRCMRSLNQLSTHEERGC